MSHNENIRIIYLYVIIWRKIEKIDSWRGRSGAADRRGQRFHTGPDTYHNSFKHVLLQNERREFDALG